MDGSNSKDSLTSINDLPDKILEYIISFLPSKQAVQTSLLAKRWRYLWTSVPILHFDVQDFKGDNYRHDKLVFAVFSVLLRYSGNALSKFHLVLNVADDSRVCSYIDLWLEFACSKKVLELHLDLHADKLGICSSKYNKDADDYSSNNSDDSADDSADGSTADEDYYSDSSYGSDNYSNSYIIPKKILSCKLLRALSLKCCKISSCGAYDLRSMVDLHLIRIAASQERLQNLISNCSVLKNLQVEGCNSINRLQVTGLHLRKMVLKCCHNLKDLEIDAPKLTSFEYVGNMPEDFVFYLVNSPDMTSASVCFCRQMNTKRDSWLSRFRDFVGKFVHVRSLKLSTKHIEELRMSKDFLESIPPALLKLKRLELTGRVNNENAIVAVASLLKSSPCLEELSLSLIPKRQKKMDPTKGEVLDYPGPTVKHQLKQVKISHYEGCKEQAALVKLLLSNGNALEVLSVQSIKLSFSEHLTIYGLLLNWRANPNTKIAYE